jgi:hypothetical protein
MMPVDDREFSKYRDQPMHLSKTPGQQQWYQDAPNANLHPDTKLQ